MAAREDNCSGCARVRHLPFIRRVSVHYLYRNQLVRRECSRLIEEHRVDLARKRNAVRLRAEDARLHERHQRGVDRHRRLHWERARHDGRDDDHALEQQLVRGAVALLQPSLEDIRRGDQSEAQEDEQGKQRLPGVIAHLLLRELDHLHELTLRRREAGAQDEAQAAAVGRRRHAAVGRLLRRARLRHRDQRGAREEHGDAVGAVHVERLVALLAAERILHLWDRLARQRRLVRHGGAPQQHAVTGDDVVRAAVLGGGCAGGGRGG
mmetsp:Transcript_17848/g.37969  ORF Transcript_17848/g.37969 Transcript_17848/m.37969 type:complete len:266 (+) Transcript_17848:3130-3927(+)